MIGNLNETHGLLEEEIDELDMELQELEQLLDLKRRKMELLTRKSDLYKIIAEPACAYLLVGFGKKMFLNRNICRKAPGDSFSNFKSTPVEARLQFFWVPQVFA